MKKEFKPRPKTARPAPPRGGASGRPPRPAGRPRPDRPDRPKRPDDARGAVGERPPRRFEREGGEARPYSPRPGFTVTLDPDVARVFRGDASVNKALRLVMQLTQVLEGPSSAAAPAPRSTLRPREGWTPPRRGGYQGSPQARGFTRRPRDDDQGGGA